MTSDCLILLSLSKKRQKKNNFGRWTLPSLVDIVSSKGYRLLVIERMHRGSSSNFFWDTLHLPNCGLPSNCFIMHGSIVKNTTTIFLTLN